MTYSPCRYGIHICGIDEGRDEFVTLANYPRVSRAMFEILRDDFALEKGEDPDVVVDFMCDGDIVDDFGMRRQFIQSMAAIIAAETTSASQ